MFSDSTLIRLYNHFLVPTLKFESNSFQLFQISHWISHLTINALASLKIKVCVLTQWSNFFFFVSVENKSVTDRPFIEWVYKDKSKNHHLLEFTKLALTCYLLQLLQVLEHHHFHTLSLLILKTKTSPWSLISCNG